MAVGGREPIDHLPELLCAAGNGRTAILRQEYQHGDSEEVTFP